MERKKLTIEDLKRAKEAMDRAGWFGNDRAIRAWQGTIDDFERWLVNHPDADIEAVREIRRRLATAKLELLKLNNTEDDD